MFDTDIRGVTAEKVIKVKPLRELWVNGTRLDAGVVYTVPADFDLVSHCRLVEEKKPVLPVKEETKEVEEEGEKGKKGKKGKNEKTEE